MTRTLRGFEELVDSGPTQSLRRRIKNQTVVATPARRKIFAAARRLLISGEVRVRRRFARTHAHLAYAKLDPHQGYKVIPPGLFEEVDDIVKSSLKLVSDFKPEENWDRAPRQVGGYSIGLIDPKQLTSDSSFLRFILRPDIIAMASAYLGMVPVISSVQVWHSRFSGKNSTRGQLFHLDPEDISAFRVFVYCNDLESTGGPFVVMNAESSDRIQRSLAYKCGGTFLPVGDERICTLVSPDELSSVAGPAGTVVFADTCRCFHYGSRVKEGATRTFAVFTLVAPSALVLPVAFRQALPLVHLATPDRTPLERLVLGGKA